MSLFWFVIAALELGVIVTAYVKPEWFKAWMDKAVAAAEKIKDDVEHKQSNTTTSNTA